MMDIMMTFETRTRVNLFDQTNRKFLKEGNLQKQCRRGRKEFKYWLFSDKLLYGELNGLGSYRVNRQILFTEMRITSTDTVENHERSFLIESKAKSFVTWAKDVSERNEWYNAIMDAMLANNDMIKETTGIAPLWTPDSAQSNCEECNVLFNLMTRRHHCRNCGKLLCGGCSIYRCMVPHVNPNNKVRVCVNCCRELSPDEVNNATKRRSFLTVVSGLMSTNSPVSSQKSVYNESRSPNASIDVPTEVKAQRHQSLFNRSIENLSTSPSNKRGVLARFSQMYSHSAGSPIDGARSSSIESSDSDSDYEEYRRKNEQQTYVNEEDKSVYTNDLPVTPPPKPPRVSSMPSSSPPPLPPANATTTSADNIEADSNNEYDDQKQTIYPTFATNKIAHRRGSTSSISLSRPPPPPPPLPKPVVIEQEPVVNNTLTEIEKDIESTVKFKPPPPASKPPPPARRASMTDAIPNNVNSSRNSGLPAWPPKTSTTS
eukprot:gene19391-25260_t